MAQRQAEMSSFPEQNMSTDSSNESKIQAVEVYDAATLAESSSDIVINVPQQRQLRRIDTSGLTAELCVKNQMELRFSDLNVFIPEMIHVENSAKSERKTSAHQPREKQIMYNVSGAVQPGELLGLLGPSGSGKTTLVSILGGRAPRNMRLEGAITLNGQPVTKQLKRRVAFVSQDDHMFANLTVYETLYYSAILRLPQGMTRAEKAERVEIVLQVLGLTKVRNTIIGGFFRRGVSGGERKRVSVGQELLINPSLLLLDEPTSGLDSTTALHLITLMKDLARAGRTILTTIHQPSSKLYLMLDKSMLLSEGHVVYYGSSGAAAKWFQEQGVQCPYGMNIADFMLDVANGDFSVAEGEYSGTIADLIRSYEAQIAASSKRSTGYAAVQIAKSANIATYQNTESEQEAKESLLHFFTNKKWGATYNEQIAILLQRSFRQRRFDSVNLDRTVMLILVGVIAGTVWFRTGASQTAVAARDLVGLLFFELLFMSFTSMFLQVFTFPVEHQMMVKERQSGMYRLSAYYVARVLADVPLEYPLPTLYCAIIYFLSGLRLSAWAFFANIATNLALVSTASATGLLIGAITMQMKRSQTVATVFLLLFMLVAGFYSQNVPSWLEWVKFTSFVFYGFHLLLAIEFRGRDIYDCGERFRVKNPATDPECVLTSDLQESLGVPFDPEVSVVRSVVVMFVLLVGTRLLCYCVLRLRTRK